MRAWMHRAKFIDDIYLFLIISTIRLEVFRGNVLKWRLMIYAKLHLIYLHVLYVYQKICFSTELYHIGTSGSITIFFFLQSLLEGNQDIFLFPSKDGNNGYSSNHIACLVILMNCFVAFSHVRTSLEKLF
jgi:hypothetical protein